MLDFYDIFEKLGYTKSNLEKRVKIYDNAAKGGTLICRRNWKEDLDIEVCGSRGEGIECSVESDLDVLFIQRSVKCFDNHLNSLESGRVSIIFSLDLENVPNGYTKLRFQSFQPQYHSMNSNFFKNVGKAIEYRNGSYYLTNKGTLTTAIEYRHVDHSERWLKQHIGFDEIEGPSRPFRFKIPVLDVILLADFVQALPCHFPSLVDAWCTRKRRFDWPSEDLIEKVKGLDVFVVPVGKKGSRDEVLQWRISMTLAERALVRSFSDFQIRLYAAVKMIVKQELKPICIDIKSYLIKNITFWVFEDEQISDITKNKFESVFVKVLEYFKDCITRNEVQCYTMPSRNLLENMFTENQTQQLTRHLEILISEGIFSLLRCPLVIALATQSKTTIVSLILTEVMDKVSLSLYALQPATVNILENMLFNAKSEEEVFMLYRTIVIPLIQETNPFEYFGLIKTLTTEQLCYLLFMVKHFNVFRQNCTM